MSKLLRIKQSMRSKLSRRAERLDDSVSSHNRYSQACVQEYDFLAMVAGWWIIKWDILTTLQVSPVEFIISSLGSQGKSQMNSVGFQNVSYHIFHACFTFLIQTARPISFLRLYEHFLQVSLYSAPICHSVDVQTLHLALL